MDVVFLLQELIRTINFYVRKDEKHKKELQIVTLFILAYTKLIIDIHTLNNNNSNCFVQTITNKPMTKVFIV